MGKQKDKFKIGDTVISKINGKGIVKNINPYDSYFHYFVSFEDGTLAWRSEKALQTQK